MGTTASTPEEEGTTAPTTQATTPPTSEENPLAASSSSDTLFQECEEMADASFLVYSFAYMLSAARANNGSLAGLKLDEKGRLPSSTSFTPQQVSDILKNNFVILKNHFAEKFEDPTLVQQSLDRLVAKTAAAGETSGSKDPPLTLQHFDDTHQEHEMVYAIAKNDLKKRITVVFRGTDNDLAFYTNWSTNINSAKTAVDMPDRLKGKVGDKTQVWIHSGFYSYLFNKTFDDSDDPELRKFDEVLGHVEAMLKENPGYELHVTGHSLGAALSTVAAFFLACRSDIPNPVTCINFAAPRVGDEAFLEAVQVLEQEGALRICRVVNDNDSIAFLPMWYYSHVGFQVRLYKGATSPSVITYPKLNDSWYNWASRIYDNSLLVSLNLNYDHGEYRERVAENKEYLAKDSLDALYANTELTGFPK